jgi:3-hydroxyacyl-CoA dehydrogenase
VGEFLREYLIPTLRYADRIKEEISHSILDFDRVMMWGFGWTMGPFAMIDAIGHERLGISPTEPFYHAQSLRDFTGAFHKIIEEPEFKPLESYPEVGLGNTYRLRDLGDGVTAIVLTTKMGVITPQNLAELTDLLTHKVDKFVLTSEARSFSAGFDLHFFGHAIDSGQPEKIEEALLALQTFGEVLQRRHCAAAIFGHCLGAGLELALSCPTIVAAAECQIGLPESRVGLIPGGRGTALMRIYNGHSIKRLTEVAVTLAEGTIAPNADAARQLGYLRPTDVTVYNPDSLIFEAKKAVLESVPTKELSWPPIVGPLVGMIDRELAALRQNSEFTEYDEIIGGKIRQIFAKSTDYEDALRRERTEFVDLCNRNLTHARIRHMLSTGKPMRN